MQPACPLCSTLLPILEKYSSLDLIEALDLQKEDISTFVQFVSSWPQSRCFCLCRDGTTIERFSALVEWLLLYIINLLQTFTHPENASSISSNEDDGTSSATTTTTTSSICSILTTTDQDQQRQYRQWTLEEKERLLLCVARCFTLSLPIYSGTHRNPSLANHLAYYQIQHASTDYKNFLSSYCHLNLSSSTHPNGSNSESHHVSLYLYRHICSFCENRGLIVIRQVFESAKNTQMLPLSIAHALFVILTNLRHHLNVDIIKNFLLPIRPPAIRYMCLLSDNELRLCGQKNTNEFLYVALKDLYIGTNFRQRSSSSTGLLTPYNTSKHHHHHSSATIQPYRFDGLMLKLALKYLTCSTLTIRLTGLSHITNQIQQCLEYSQYRRHQSISLASASAAASTHPTTTTQDILTVSESEGEDEGTGRKVQRHRSSSSTSSHEENEEFSSNHQQERKLAQWIIENKIVDYLFGPNLHTELIKQCSTILMFLASNHCLTVEHIDMIWSCASLTHCSRHILDLLMTLGQKHFQIHLLNHLLQLIGRSDRSQYTESTLTLISILTKSYWSQLIRSSHHLLHNRKQQQHELMMKKKFQEQQKRNSSQISALHRATTAQQQKTLKRAPISPLKRLDRKKNIALIRHRTRLQTKTSPTSPSSPPLISRPLAMKKSYPNKGMNVDEDSTEEVIIVESPQQPCPAQLTPTLNSESNGYPSTSENLLPTKKNKDADDWSEDDDDDEEEEQMTGRTVLARSAAPFHRPSSNDEDDEEDEDCETQLIPREVLMQRCQRFQRRTTPERHPDESDDEETTRDLAPIYKAEDLSTPTKRPSTGSGFIINHSKGIALPDDRMEIDEDEEENPSDEDLRPMALPSVVQSSLKRRSKEKETDATRKKFQEKICSPESAEDASQAGSLPSEMETEIYDCRETIRTKKKRTRHHTDDEEEEDDDEEEADFASSASDVLSETGSAKNMADFEDMSENEQSQIQTTNLTRRHFTEPSTSTQRKRQESEANLASQTSSSSSSSSSTESNPTASIGDDEMNIANLSAPGQTLLWDLLQDQSGTSQGRLPENLLHETERLFGQVLNLIEDRHILLHFIQASLENLKKSQSSLISLRLLPKLFLIFQQHNRPNGHVFLLFEQQFHVLHAFFNDLEQLTERFQSPTPMQIVQNEMNVRFQFLSFIFSTTASPKDFHLTQEQADRLWDCFTSIAQSTGTTREDLYNWLLSQLKNRDGGHALSLETFKHLLTEKLLTLKPEQVCCQQLNLINEILQQSRAQAVHHAQQVSLSTEIHDETNDFQTFESLTLNYLSDVAMRALDQNVSTLAAQTLNSYQIQNEDGTLDREEPFIARCMNCLVECLQTVEDLSSLRTINRICVLLRTHLELFMRRYSYVIHLYQFLSPIHPTQSSLKPHLKQLSMTDDRETNLLRLICTAPLSSGTTEKCTLRMSPGEFLGDLRAELTRWYCSLKPSMTNVLTQSLLTVEKNDFVPSNSSAFDLLQMSNLPSIRVLANGQELEREMDDKTLSECNIKDNQPILVNATNRTRTKDLYNIDERLLKNYIPQKMPMMLLLKSIEQIFAILAQLQQLIEKNVDHTEARMAVQRFWDILLLIPTHNGILQKLSQLNDFLDHQANTEQWNNFLQRSDPFRLTYSLQIIDMLIRRLPSYKEMFVRKGGLKYLYDLFISKSVFTGSTEQSWCAALPDALLHTLRILCSCLLKVSHSNPVPAPAPPSAAPPSSSNSTDDQHSPRTPINSRKKTRRESTTPAIIAALASTEPAIPMENSPSNSTVVQSASIPIHEPQWENVSFIDKELLLDTLFEIQLSIVTKSSRLCCPLVLLQFSNRTDLLHTSMILFIALCHSFDEIRTKFIQHPKLSLWLKTLLLDTYDTMLKREAQSNIYRLCMVPSVASVSSTSGTTEEFQIQPMTEFLPPPAPLPSQRTCPIDEEKAAQTISQSQSIVTPVESTPERICLVPILTHLFELIPYALKFTSSSSSSSSSNLDSISSSSLQSLNLSSTILNKYENHSLYVNQSSHEYFHLLTSIIDRMHSEEIKQVQIHQEKLSNQSNGTSSLIGFDHQLIEILMNFVHEHVPYEMQRDKFLEDEVLFGLINLLTSIVRQYNHHQLKQSKADDYRAYSDLTLKIIDRVFKYLFELPTSENRCVPKCKSIFTRARCYEFLNELIKVNRENFVQLQRKLLEQHNSVDRQQPYVWDYWPRDDGRSYSGYVGLTNLGATCYAATSIQHLYMIPELRNAILNAKNSGKHELILYELKRMFAFLLESERRSYNPKSFCKVYTMDGLQLNTGDQKDMTEFFTDLITKLEEMSDDLKQLVRELFCGTLTNIVLSFDCPHVSRKLEEFYTVRCQVADMKDVHESLAELTVKDTLEGDNMYTCSKCSKKVRAEKRVCFRKLPKILCLNTMRYTFNMVTMQREKVNTLFQFPMQLDMSGYMEQNLIDRNKLIGDEQNETDEETSNPNESHLFELIGVTVHTGTAEGGHYYSFIRERVKRAGDTTNNENLIENGPSGHQHRWYLFNDAEVKQFDPSQIASECFGGEITSKGYDQGSDRFLDFQFEKTHSAYMLFYERIDPLPNQSNVNTLQLKDSIVYHIPKEISDWIWEDNRRFVRDRHLFDHNYFTFMWMLCHHQMPAAHTKESDPTIDILPIQLAITFVFETYIHAKDKPAMAGWVEYLSKQFTACKPVATWFLAHMTEDETWLTKVLVRCPNHTIRQMFERVLIDVLHKSRFRDSSTEDSLVVQQFIRKYLSIISEGGARLPIRYMSEYFLFLHDFARNGVDECYLLLDCQCIQQIITFYMLHRGRQAKQSSTNHPTNTDDGNTSSDDENQSNGNLLMPGAGIDDDIIPLNTIRLPNNNNLNRPGIFEKMFPLIALLLETERARSNFDQFDFQLFIENDFAFIQQQIFDNINLKSTAHIIQLICYKNEVHATKIVNLLCQWIMSSTNDINSLQALFKVLTYLIEHNPNHITTENNDAASVSSSNPIDKHWCDFSNLIVARIGKLIDICPTQVFEWLNNVVNKSPIIHRWVLENIRPWLKSYLLFSTYTKVRTLLAQLLVSLVPSSIFRQTYRTGKFFLNLSKQTVTSNTTTNTTHGTITSLLTFNQQISTVSNSTSFIPLFDHQQFSQYPAEFTPETFQILRTLLNYLLELLIDLGHDPSDLHLHDHQQRLVQYLSVLIHFTRYPAEKLRFVEHRCAHALCSLILHTKLMEDHTSNNGNKLLIFILLQQLAQERPFLTYLLNHEHEFQQHLPMCLVIVDHEDQDLVAYNRLFLFIYYNTLRQFCASSNAYARSLASHKNIFWAVRNILQYVQLYQDACDQLLSICKTICHRETPTIDETELQVIQDFKRELLTLIYRFNDIRTSWTVILDLTRDIFGTQSTHEERLLILQRRGLPVLTNIFSTIYALYHDQSQVHPYQDDLIYLLGFIASLLETADAELEKQKTANPTIAPTTTPTVSMKTIVGNQWKEKMELVGKLLLLLNSYNNSDIRQRAVDLLKKIIVQLSIQDLTTIASQIKSIHEQAAQTHSPLGPYFPRRKQSNPNNPQRQGTIDRLTAATTHTPFRPQFGMHFKTQLLETSKGRDQDFDRAVHAYYSPYHFFIDSMARYAFNANALNGSILNLVILVACEGIQSVHLHLFAKLCLEIADQSKTSAQTLIQDLLQKDTAQYFYRYIEIILIDERIALHQNDNYRFLQTYLPMILNLKKTNSANNDPMSTFLQRLEQLLMKTCEHSLQSIINESQSNLDWFQSSKKLFKSIDYSHNQIIGDIKALEIYLHCPINPERAKIQSVIEQNIRFLDQRLHSPLPIDEEHQPESDAAASNIDDESTPMKKRRLDESTSVSDSSNNNDPKRKAITDALQILQNFLNHLNNQSISSEE